MPVYPSMVFVNIAVNIVHIQFISSLSLGANCPHLTCTTVNYLVTVHIWFMVVALTHSKCASGLLLLPSDGKVEAYRAETKWVLFFVYSDGGHFFHV